MEQPPPTPLPPLDQSRPRSSTSPAMIVLMVLGGCATVGVVLVAVLAALLFPVFSQAREAARGSSCLSNTKQLGTGLLMYVSDYDEQFPPSEAWFDNLQPYVKNVQVGQCPSAPDLPLGYAYNETLSRKKLENIPNPATYPAIYDSLLGIPNASDSLGSFATRHRRSGGVKGNVVFADGHAQSLAAAPAADGSSPAAAE